MKSSFYVCLVVLLLCQSSFAQEPATKAADSKADGKAAVQEGQSKAGSQSKTAVADQEAVEKKSGPLVAGDNATDFELQSIGKKIRLSDNFGEEGNPVVVVFSRANW